MSCKRSRPKQHVRKFKSGKIVKVNKGVVKKKSFSKKSVSGKSEAINEIRFLMSENRSLAKQRGSIVSKQDNLYPLSLETRNEMDREENSLQRKGSINRRRMAFLEKKYGLVNKKI